MKPENKIILAVEDDEASREFLSEVINNLGYIFIAATNGQNGIDLFRKHGADLVLLDIRLPDINGLEVLAEIKKLSAGTPVIAQTAFAMQKEKEEFLSNGFDGYLSKPIRPDTLISVIDEFLGADNH